MTEFTAEVIRLIKQVPKGKVCTYGRIAAMAGDPRGARQVVRILNSSSESHKLPWHRIVNREGRIMLPLGNGFEIQKALLEKEKVKVSPSGKIDLAAFLWQP